MTLGLREIFIGHGSSSKLPPRKSAHLSIRRAHVSLVEAGIAARVDLRCPSYEIEKRRQAPARADLEMLLVAASVISTNGGSSCEDENDDDIGVKVAGD